MQFTACVMIQKLQGWDTIAVKHLCDVITQGNVGEEGWKEETERAPAKGFRVEFHRIRSSKGQQQSEPNKKKELLFTSSHE